MSEELKSLIKNRAVIKGSVTRLQSYLNNLEEFDIDELETRKIKLEEYFNSFLDVQFRIELITENDESNNSDHENERSRFDDQYFKCAKLINQKIRSLGSNHLNSNQTKQSNSFNVQQKQNLLPKLEIKPFDGNPINWHGFHDTFKNLVHDNNDLIAVQKFYLLQNALQGEVASVISNLNASEENYHVAWNLLIKKCNKPRQIIQTHLGQLLELPEIGRDGTNLGSFSEKAQMHINALKSLNQPIEHWDSILVYIIIRKLDKQTRKVWERNLDNEEMPTFKQLIEFLNKQARGEDFETLKVGNQRTIKQQFRGNSRGIHSNNSQQNHVYHSTQTRPNCPICNQTHTIYTCSKFLEYTTQQRAEEAKNKKLCMNCLKSNHTTYNCYLEGCRKCNRKHNTLLHFNSNNENNLNTSNTIETSTPNDSVSNQPNINLTVSGQSEILLGTACVKMLDKHKNEINCRVLLDSGSQSHFITENLAERLGLEKQKINKPFFGLGQNRAYANYGITTIIKSKTTAFETKLSFVALPTITSLLPTKQIKNTIDIPRNIVLADQHFYKPSPIDALIGSDVFYQLLSIGQIKLCGDAIILQKTLLGWIVTGQAEVNYPIDLNTNCFLTSLETQLAKFWEIENIPNKTYLSSEESACENYFKVTTKRDTDGRYIVKLPFNEKKSNLGESYDMALNRFKYLEKRLTKDKELQLEYNQFLKEYLGLKHMTDITEIDCKTTGYYLPHHAVVKQSSLTTKIRVVFDGSAKTSNQISLNDILMNGPTIQDNLFSIILRFRTHRYALTADIEKMFRQIKVANQDAIYQKILWRSRPDEILKTYQLNTITYGMKPSPYIAVRCLKQLSIDEGDKFPLASIVINRDFYVDDVLTGSDTLENAMELKEQLSGLLALGGFNLRQWLSNEHSLLLNSNEKQIQFLSLDRDNAKKVLGIQWQPALDTISYDIKSFKENKRVTKRIMLSEIAQLFDPLGLLGPVIIKSKLMMQEIWKLNLNWDESLPQKLALEWLNFKNQLSILNKFNLNRRIMIDNACHLQIHGFCDASERAYGACIYLRSTDDRNQHNVSLICAKSRVAPLKTITLPKLELSAATLLAKLYKTVINSLNIKIDRTRFWSDSTITLNWIKAYPHTLKTFVANRVAHIQENTNTNDWYHVKTHDNPADYLTRGQLPNLFLNNHQWVKGPNWLSRNEENWDYLPLAMINNLPEQRASVALIAIRRKPEFFEKFSSITMLIRVVAYILRLVNNIRTRSKLVGSISCSELANSELRIIKIIQEYHFANEIHLLNLNKSISKNSRLVSLNPFIDKNGILRVGGRLQHSNLNYSQKHPILLPSHEHVTKLIIQREHIQNWHTGVQTTLNLTRQKYWPINGRNETKCIIRKCVRCFKIRPQVPNYVMGNLPPNRIMQSRPFENVGIDYCGPFFIKERKFRNKIKLKSYVAVFVCFSSKAVHLELVTDLTAEACLAAINRFFARRGKSKNIYSDNGTNFVGAKNEILRAQQAILSDNFNTQINHYLANEGINWHFNPPRSPHFGGLWESLVKSFKTHLYRTVGDSLFTYEEFNTYIIQIEAIINSRPLTPISSDPNDFNVLTPAHFLIGDSLRHIPEDNFTDTKINKLSRWQHIQRLKQHFWSRWHKEYLNELNVRNKWHQNDKKQLKIGSLVLIKEENIPPLRWKLGRIATVHPGEDGVVRVISVKTQNGVYKRAIKNICPLPIEE